MQYIVLAVILAVMQALPPIPRQASDSPAGASKKVQNQPKSEQTDPKHSPASVNADQTQSHDPHTGKQTGEDTPNSIKVSELPPVTVAGRGRDWADWGYWCFSLLLVIVGALQVWLLRSTLLAIQTQAGHMERQAGIMEGQLEAMKEAGEQTDKLIEHAERQATAADKTLILQYRPRIAVRNVRVIRANTEIGKSGELTLSCQVVNIGGSAARRITGSVHVFSCVASDVEKIDFIHGEEREFSLDALEPGQRNSYEDTLPTGTVNDEGWFTFYGGETVPRHYVYLWGNVWYFDDLGIPRQTGIYRKFDPKYMRFEPEKDSEQEYSD
jgi:hypothetical protein